LVFVPTKPETGYGYIERSGDNVISFREKPNQVSPLKGTFMEQRYVFFLKQLSFRRVKKYTPEVYEKSQIVWENNKW
jgi:mannose-1-phosphate guanylyltransferase